MWVNVQDGGSDSLKSWDLKCQEIFIYYCQSSREYPASFYGIKSSPETLPEENANWLNVVSANSFLSCYCQLHDLFLHYMISRLFTATAKCNNILQPYQVFERNLISEWRLKIFLRRNIVHLCVIVCIFHVGIDPSYFTCSCSMWVIIFEQPVKSRLVGDAIETGSLVLDKF